MSELEELENDLRYVRDRVIETRSRAIDGDTVALMWQNRMKELIDQITELRQRQSSALTSRK